MNAREKLIAYYGLAIVYTLISTPLLRWMMQLSYEGYEILVLRQIPRMETLIADGSYSGSGTSLKLGGGVRISGSSYTPQARSMGYADTENPNAVLYYRYRSLTHAKISWFGKMILALLLCFLVIKSAFMFTSMVKDGCPPGFIRAFFSKNIF